MAVDSTQRLIDELAVATPWRRAVICRELASKAADPAAHRALCDAVADQRNWQEAFWGQVTVGWVAASCLLELDPSDSRVSQALELRSDAERHAFAAFARSTGFSPSTTAPAKSLLAVSGQHKGAIFQLASDAIVIGRSASCHIALGHPSVGRRHVELRRVAEDFHIEHLGSGAVTTLNGVALGNAPVTLRGGDRFDVGTGGDSFEVIDDHSPKRPTPQTLPVR